MRKMTMSRVLGKWSLWAEMYLRIFVVLGFWLLGCWNFVEFQMVLDFVVIGLEFEEN